MNETLKISGKTFTLPKNSQHEWKFSLRPGGWIIAESSKGIRRKIMFCQGRGRVSASLGGFLFSGEWLQKHHEIAGSRSADDLMAQFPGKVRKVLVQEGHAVQEGDSLLLVEAMKMEFAIRAPYSGRIKKILVQEGQQLSPGDQFLDLEAIESGK